MKRQQRIRRAHPSPRPSGRYDTVGSFREDADVFGWSGAEGQQPMFRNDDDQQRNRPEDWAGAAVVFGVLLVIAVVLAALVSTADFGDESPSPGVTRTPGPCEPFCIAPQP